MKYKMTSYLKNKFLKEYVEICRRPDWELRISCFLLGRNKDKIARKAILLEHDVLHSCDYMMGFTSAVLSRAYIQICKADFSPCGIVRIGRFMERLAYNNTTHFRFEGLVGPIAERNKGLFILTIGSTNIDTWTIECSTSSQSRQLTEHELTIV